MSTAGTSEREADGVVVGRPDPSEADEEEEEADEEEIGEDEDEEGEGEEEEEMVRAHVPPLVHSGALRVPAPAVGQDLCGNHMCVHVLVRSNTGSG